MNGTDLLNARKPWVERHERELSFVNDAWNEWIGKGLDIASGVRLRDILAARMATWRDPSSVQAGIVDVLSPFVAEWRDKHDPQKLSDILSNKLIQAGRMNPLKS